MGLFNSKFRLAIALAVFMILAGEEDKIFANAQRRTHQQQRQQQQRQQPKAPKGPNYYDLLGVKKDATEKELQKAFKKKAIQYHPDKNPDDPDAAKEKFQEIANAYEILTDEEKRRIYDQLGEDGLDQHKQQEAAREQQGARFGGGGFGGQGMNMDDIFKNMFGQQGRGGGGNQGFRVNFGQKGQQQGGGFNFGQGGQHHQQHHQQVQYVNMFEQTDVIQLDLGSMSQFYRRDEIWVIYFFNPDKKECQDFKDIYKDVSERLYGMVKVAAIDCGQEEELCEEFGVYDPPKIMIFNEKFSDDGELFSGEMVAEKIMGAASKRMQNFVSVVTSENYDSWVERDRLTKQKILLFTDKKTTPTMFKSFSKKHISRLNLGEVKQSEEELCKKYGVTDFPTILALTNPEDFESEKYEGEMNVDQVSKFLNTYAYATPKKPIVTDFTELTVEKYRQNKLCGPKTSSICVLIFIKDGKQKLIEKLKPAIGYFVDEAVSFAYVDATKEPEIYKAFEKEKAVLFKPKRHNYQPLPTETADELREKVSDLIGGGGSGTWSKAGTFVFSSEKTDEL